MHKTAVFFVCLLFACGVVTAQQKKYSISKLALKDKIKGGWAGQTIGVTYGGPMEFRYCGTMINAYQPIPWYDGYVKKTMLESPGLYDDLYMDLTFVEVFEKEGLDAPVASHAKAFANAGYALWHANQAARYNILQGIMPPQSGYWENNPHADCIDYQIESDFAGLMSPGMPNVAAKISDKIGHIMNYGDGYYGGVFLGSCYTLAFVSSDIPQIINEALKTIPSQSKYYQCISDVIRWHKAYPTDWTKTWFELQKKWAQDIGCPDGVFAPFNIDATINSAYVVIGLLYGNGDFSKTMDITTRCGQDADCNPSSAGGILGTILGYNKIPDYWKKGLKDAEQIDFKYTSTSLADVYEIGYKHALQNIAKNGGDISKDVISLPYEAPKAVKLEQSFGDAYPISQQFVNKALEGEYNFDFTGTGFVVKGETARWNSTSQYVFELEVYIDNQLFEKAKLPVAYTTRRHELTWKYKLPLGKHLVRLKLLNPVAGEQCRISDILIYGTKPVQKTK
ncbi:ADP-ribosylglycohydrolase family protein [Flavihumibacter profundi]|uniref:ADP-ribosylglycohydrolase family protein n=1 Tax=Flavihumibacter profundi TaxID=2716883 RepID=UPI001CC41DBF|nr:ADP-ribosylglycohydrolase family protein [Flavihumibacter profundi]MBZ5857241.1 ADP-ribosylglycohydrolase family protein [Flavihumibacter profundi]